MRYRIKAFLFKNGTQLDCRFECVMNDFEDVVTFLSRVSLDAYDVVKVLPDGYTEV